MWIAGRIVNAARRLGTAALSLHRDRRGAVMIFVALAAIPLIGGVGIGVDVARAYMVRARLSQALDAATLAGGRVMYDATRNADIIMYFNANFPQGFLGATVTPPDASTIIYNAAAQTITVTAQASLPTTLVSVFGLNTVNVSASSTVTRANSGMELVLVMDNTGSMLSNDKIGAMKAAATSLVNTVYGEADTVPNLYVGLVPFVGMVNVGNGHGSWTTTPTYTTFSVATSGSAKQLTRTTNSGPSSPGTSTVCVTVTADFDGNVTAGGLRDGMLIDIAGASQTAYNGRFQINVGTANSTTGCTIDSGNYKRRFWYLINTTSGTTPATGTITAKRPTVTYPAGAPWKGCVEMRPDPYETTSADASPGTSSFPKTYWPSTNGVRWYDTVSSSSYFKYMMKKSSSSTNYVIGDNQWTTSTYDESTSTNSRGPNKGCPTAVTPLQPSKATALAAISAMQPWWGGGTAVPTGLAWGWRVLSPSFRGLWGSPTPGTLPLNYNTEKMTKVVVLLTDGVNEVVQGSGIYSFTGTPNAKMPGCDPQGGSYCTVSAYQNYRAAPFEADYTAYGRPSERRFGSTIDTDAEVTAELNTRVASLCSAMKTANKGIIIYTILLQVNDATTDQLYRDCASKPEYYFNSPTSSDLAGIFNQIAVQLSKLRVSQ